jgi:hypothetical protein
MRDFCAAILFVFPSATAKNLLLYSAGASGCFPNGALSRFAGGIRLCAWRAGITSQPLIGHITNVLRPDSLSKWNRWPRVHRSSAEEGQFHPGGIMT